MMKTILTYGLLSGAVVSVMLGIATVFEDNIGFDHGAIVGYTSILLASLLIFFGVRTYRDQTTPARLTFGRAFGVGLAIGLISCVCYVICWEIVYYNFMPDFIDKFAAHSLAKAKANGASAAALAALAKQMDSYRALYANPLSNAAITFLEPFPIELLAALLSAVILRTRERKGVAGSPLTAL